MALTAQGSALVAGGNPGGGAAASARVLVVRAFCVRGERQEPGAIIEVSALLARELVSVGKAAWPPEKAAEPPAENPTAQSAPPPRRGRQKE